MGQKDIQQLQERIKYLENQIKYYQASLKKYNIDYQAPKTEIIRQGIKQETITQGHVKFFYSIFKGRKDVYSKRAGKANKTGYVGYYPQCNNFWKAGICAKRSSQRIKCQDCSNQDYKELNGYDLMNHLLGKKEDCSDVIGIYPILKDETCHFLVFDFDNHDDNYSEDNYLEEVNALKTICKENQINILVERSRSGKGIHIWLFFEKAIKASIETRFVKGLFCEKT